MDVSSLVAGQSSPFGCGSKRICSRGHGSLFGALNPTRSGLLHKISASLLNFCLEMLKPREESDEGRGGESGNGSRQRHREQQAAFGTHESQGQSHSRSRAGAGSLGKKREEECESPGERAPGDQTARTKGCPSPRGAGGASSPEVGLPTLSASPRQRAAFSCYAHRTSEPRLSLKEWT